tara:strand:+ start:759 stop:1397 length:639 start_codon:yes stop_codon:yes gene_type:complete
MSEITLTYIDPIQQEHEISYDPEEDSHSRYGSLFYSHKIISTPSPDQCELEAVKATMAEFGLKRNTSIRNTLETWMGEPEVFSEEIQKHYKHAGDVPLEDAMNTAHYDGDQVDECQVDSIENVYQNYEIHEQEIVRAWWSEDGVGEPDDAIDSHISTHQSIRDAEEELADNEIGEYAHGHLEHYIDRERLGSDLIDEYRVIEFEGDVFLYQQ